MLRFEDPIFLWLLLVIPLLVLIRLYNWRKRRRKFQKFGDLALLKTDSYSLGNANPHVSAPTNGNENLS